MAEYYCERLPARLEWELFDGDWDMYKSALYKIFKRDLIENDLFFHGKSVDIIHEHYYEGKERSFWHIISSGDDDANRAPDGERCASLSWVRPLILEDDSCDKYRLWVKWCDKAKKDRYYIWCTAVNYIVILEDRGSHFKLITAFNVKSYNVKRYEKEFNSYIKTKTST